MIKRILTVLLMVPLVSVADIEVKSGSYIYQLKGQYIKAKQDTKDATSYTIYDIEKRTSKNVTPKRKLIIERKLTENKSISVMQLEKLGVKFIPAGSSKIADLPVSIFKVYSGDKLCSEVYTSKDALNKFPELFNYLKYIKFQSLLGLKSKLGTDFSCKSITGLLPNTAESLGAPLKVVDLVKNKKLRNKSYEISQINVKSFEYKDFSVPEKGYKKW